MSTPTSRRSFLRNAGLGSLGALAAGGLLNAAPAQKPDEKILGASGVKTTQRAKGVWAPVSDRKIRVGIVGFGVCQFGAAFGFQDHPNVTVAAVSDLIPERCQNLAKACRCEKTYPSLEELVKDDTIEAVFVATDAPNHAKHCIDVLKHGKHVACAVPAVWGSMEDAEKLLAAVKSSGLKYMMFETSCGHADLWAMRQRYEAGELGKIIYSEGEYYHYMPNPYPGYNPKTNNVDPAGWRNGGPPQWYPTHSNAYYIGVTGGSFTEVSCMGMPGIAAHLRPENNPYKNPFGSEIALFRTSEGGMSRMAVCFDLPAADGEQGRVYGQKNEKVTVNTDRPPLPPGMGGGTHRGGNHLMCDFVDAILRDRKPRVDVAQALNMTVAGIVAHQSALKNGELMKIPQYVL